MGDSMTSSSFRLSLPTDIPWQRICASQDMLDNAVCDDELPPKWHSSLAIFKYVPDDEYQQFPDYKISYVKVSATITGYQPKDKQVEGEIDWDRLSIATSSEEECLAYSPKCVEGEFSEV